MEGNPKGTDVRHRSNERHVRERGPAGRRQGDRRLLGRVVRPVPRRLARARPDRRRAPGQDRQGEHRRASRTSRSATASPRSPSWSCSRTASRRPPPSARCRKARSRGRSASPRRNQLPASRRRQAGDASSRNSGTRGALRGTTRSRHALVDQLASQPSARSSRSDEALRDVHDACSRQAAAIT